MLDFWNHSCHLLLADILRLENAVKHRWGVEMTTQAPFILLSDRKKVGWD